MVTKGFYIHSDGDMIKSGSKKYSEVGQISINFEICDKFLGPSFKLTVPSNLTVFYEHQTLKRCDSTDFEEKRSKLKVLLIGNEICPDLSILDCNNIDRIEFHGSICFDQPVFEMIYQLGRVKKVKFFLGNKQLLSFKSFVIENLDKRFINKSVTSLTILTDKCCSKNQKLETTLEEIVSQILQKSAHYFPYLRKLTLEVMNSIKTKKVVKDVMDKLQFLKHTDVESSRKGDRLIVKKSEASLLSLTKDTKKLETSLTHSLQNVDKSDMKNSSVIIQYEGDEESILQPIKAEEDHDSDEQSVDDIELATLNASSLTDLGKLLESMLGIGTQGSLLGIGTENNDVQIENLTEGKEKLNFQDNDSVLLQTKESPLVYFSPSNICT